jgi:hypothetical protein
MLGNIGPVVKRFSSVKQAPLSEVGAAAVYFRPKDEARGGKSESVIAAGA